MVEIGQIDLTCEISMLASYCTMPREGHLTAVLRTFAYCKKHISSRIVFDHFKKDFSGFEWESYEWKDFYPDVRGEVLPPRMPKPKGKSVQINMFCDASHASCLKPDVLQQVSYSL